MQHKKLTLWVKEKKEKMSLAGIKMFSVQGIEETKVGSFSMSA